MDSPITDSLDPTNPTQSNLYPSLTILTAAATRELTCDRITQCYTCHPADMTSFRLHSNRLKLALVLAIPKDAGLS